MDASLTDEERAFANEVRTFLEENLEAPPTFATLDDEIAWGRRWQARLAADRWVGIHWPASYGGRDATPVQVALYNMEYARSRAPQPVNRVGINLAGPTLLAHGTDEQRARWLPPILRAEELWCQLFSEPGAGSDLAGLATRAVPVEGGGVEGGQVQGGWRVSGQKVWTSYAQYARWGIALVRTDPDAPKHRGLSFLVIDMEAPGIEIRPLVQITGEAEFNEVFLDDTFVPADCLVGTEHDGWRVANTTLAHERGTAFPFKEQVVHEVYLDRLLELAADRDAFADVEIADGLVDSFVALRLLRLHNWRTLSRLARGREPGADSSIVKLAWTDMTRRLSDVALTLTAETSPLWIGAEHVVDGGRWQRQWLWSMASSIAGGTSEIQRTIIGERLLGLPRG